MKANQLATLVLRLMGIYCLVAIVPVVQVFNGVILYARNSSGTFGVSLAVVTFLLVGFWLTVGISLIVFSKPLGEILTPKGSEEAAVTAISFEQAQALAFAVAGVLIFAEAVPQLVNNTSTLLDYWIRIRERNSDTVWPYQQFPVLPTVGSFFKAALGLYLFLGARGFANFWRSLRSFGTPKSPGN